ncbi:MAG: hypothetical protein ACI89J_002992 [Hyphomicrobiaceae bacterium]|jgi:hypothetical protein
MLISIGPFLRSNTYIATCWIVLSFEEATVAMDGQSVAIPCLVFFRRQAKPSFQNSQCSWGADVVVVDIAPTIASACG